nr:hypothetical protein [Tanacetum cinerariifolium]
MVECEEDEESYASDFADSMFSDDDDFGTRIEPKSRKENLEVVNDDDVTKKKDDKKDEDEEKDDDVEKTVAWISSVKNASRISIPQNNKFPVVTLMDFLGHNVLF